MEQPDLFSAPPPLPADHALIWSHLEKRLGKHAGIKQAELAMQTGLNARYIRQLCKELVEEHSKVIGSGNTGFYTPETKEEIEHVRKDLYARAMSILYRLSKLDKSSEIQSLYNQMKLIKEKSDAG